MLLSALVFIVILGILVFVHELGHFMVAKWTGMRVDEFGLGFPPHLWCKTRGETKYCINAIPIGGYVKIHGESNDEEELDDDPRSFHNRTVLQRMAVILAGVTMNLLFAFVVLTLAFSIGFVAFSQPLTDIPGAKRTSTQLVISKVLPDSPAAKAKLESGDVVVEARKVGDQNAEPIESVDEFLSYTKTLQQQKVDTFDLTILRDGTKLTRTVGISPNGYPVGVAIEGVDLVRVPFWRAPGVALHEMGYIIDITWDALRGFFAKLFFKAQLDQNVSGPVGIYQATATATQEGIVPTVFLAVVLSINLALLNVLPIPALDGGKFVFLLTELVFRKRVVAIKVENALSLIGFAFLIGLIILITVRDIARLF